MREEKSELFIRIPNITGVPDYTASTSCAEESTTNHINIDPHFPPKMAELDWSRK